MLKILFCDNDRIKVELEGNETKQYLLRPYNISDEKFSEELTTIEVELDSWGTVYLAYGNYVRGRPCGRCIRSPSVRLRH